MNRILQGYKFPDWLLEQLREIHGPPLYFHSSLVAPILEAYIPQLPWIKEQLGLSLEEDLYAFDDTAIRSEAELLHFTPEAIDWLFRQRGEKIVYPNGSPLFASEVAKQIHHLIAQPSRVHATEPTKLHPLLLKWLKYFNRFLRTSN